LNEWKWIFFEKGMIAYWNELRRLAAGTIASYPATGAGGVGNIDYATHLEPDILEKTNRPQAVGFTGSGMYGTAPPTQLQS
jgi:hypothetical protein